MWQSTNPAEMILSPTAYPSSDVVHSNSRPYACAADPANAKNKEGKQKKKKKAAKAKNDSTDEEEVKVKRKVKSKKATNEVAKPSKTKPTVDKPKPPVKRDVRRTLKKKQKG